MGYLPFALRDYLVRIGWSHGDQEIFSTEEMIKAFDRRQIERFDHLLGRENLLVTMAPADPHQIIAQRERQIPHRALGIVAECAVALRQIPTERLANQA